VPAGLAESDEGQAGLAESDEGQAVGLGRGEGFKVLFVHLYVFHSTTKYTRPHLIFQLQV
jgi:hypothetical protein